MAKGYILAEITVADVEAYRTSGYMEMAQAAVEAHGGRFMVRGGAPELLEGGPAPNRIVVLEFPSRDAARAFYTSEQYAPAIARRNQVSRGRLVLLEGYEPA